MKKYALLYVLILVTTQTFAQKKERIKGSQIVTIEQKKIGDFDTLEVEDNLEISIIKGDKCGLEIEADDNLHEALGFELSGTTLRLTTRKNVTSFKKFAIRVTYSDAFKMVIARNEAIVNALAEVQLTDITFKSYDYAKLFLIARAKNFTLMANDKSKVELNLKSENATVEMSKNAYFKALVNSTNFKLDLYQKSEAIVEGDAVNMKVRLDNNSKYTGKKIVAQNLEVTAEGSAECTVYAEKTVLIDQAGTTEMNLYGTPKIEVKRFSDRAKLFKKTDN